MSLERVRALAARLPYSLREQIEGYARSVEEAAPSIEAEARINLTPSQRDDLVYIAGIRKLYSIVSANFTVLQESGQLLSRVGVEGVRIGGTDYSPDSPFYTSLARMHTQLNIILSDLGIPRTILLGPYTDLVRRIANGHG